MPSHTSQEVLCSAYDGTLQFGRPDSTIFSAGWNAVGAPTHHEATDEVTSDDETTYAEATLPTELEMTLSSVTDPETHTGHILRFIARSTADRRGGAPERISLRLLQGVAEIASQNNIAIARSADYECHEMTLTEAEAALITDYGALRAELTALVAIGETIRVTLVEFQVPNLAAEPLLNTWLTQQTDLTPRTISVPEGLLAEAPEPAVLPGMGWLSHPELPAATRNLVPADPAITAFVPPIPGGGLAADPVPLPPSPVRPLITGELALPIVIIPPEAGTEEAAAAEQPPTFSVEPSRLVGY